ncbi:MAG: flavodoxin domain-containing protein [Micropepsaceae bacterium]
MKILIVYGTTEGQTRKIADFVVNRLKQQGETVTLTDATDAPWDLRPNEYDAAILAASLHAGVYQGPLINYARTHQARLNQMPSAFLSVSLSAAGRDAGELKGIADCADRFKRETGWTPTEIHHVAGAFRFTEYDFFKRWVMRLIAWEKGVKIGHTQELELTDWDALAKIVDGFRARAAAAHKTSSAA